MKQDWRYKKSVFVFMLNLHEVKHSILNALYVYGQ